MADTKSIAEDHEKTAEAPVIHKLPEAPDKQHGPQSVGVARAVAVDRGASAPERAHQMTIMQQTVGNARLGRMMGTPQPEAAAQHPEPATQPLAEEQEKSMDREHTPRMIAGKEKAEEMLQG